MPLEGCYGPPRRRHAIPSTGHVTSTLLRNVNKLRMFTFMLENTVAWFLQLIVGSVGTALAMLAIAFLSIGMLNGRFEVMKTIRIIVGLFILFGAPAISEGLMMGARNGISHDRARDAVPPRPQIPTTVPAFDPYAGAAVPWNQ